MKNCPFCGEMGKVIVPKELDAWESSKYQFQAKCVNPLCKMMNVASYVYKTEPEAIAIWNERIEGSQVPVKST